MKQKITISDCKVVTLPKAKDPRGNLTFIEGNNHVPFDIKRVFYLYDVPTEESRGAHAHKTLHQFLICLAGSFDVEIDDGEFQGKIHLNRPWKGLHIPPMIWAAEVDFDPGSVCLVLASELYDATDYIRDYSEFLALTNPKL
ncbi:FdtA/QdtA family cupin domain-containing protein [Methylobacter sp. S3L5C]|uniref:sugar 3,4-ketoisomerase n=1 Tax=Methylobacter sp. S3L5C TaxID=2839024 RepID=UPI001FAD1BAC|nr:FdtA/QdtA family cupin domain-containing protein [Methylobacter sp. S3L5C]UOA09531.1 FdtA/QdtA family cupin domain-containing protein [Methylobacter sp. S3L5C]